MDDMKIVLCQKDPSKGSASLSCGLQLIYECGKLAQKEYKQRHDSVGRYVHWQFCDKLGFNRVRLWYEHQPGSVVQNKNYKILLHFTTRCDHMIEAIRPDIVVKRKRSM